MRALFVTDLDGTLLAPDGAICTADREALKAARREGVVTAVVTGRRLSSLRALQPELAELDMRLATSNGSVVLAADNRKPLRVRALDWRMLDALVQLKTLRHHALIAITAPPDEADSEALDGMLLRRGTESWLGSQTLFQPESLVEIDPQPLKARALVHLALLYQERDEADAQRLELSAVLPEEVTSHVVRVPVGTGALLEVAPRGGKGLALRALAEEHDIPQNATAAIGDELNDCDLLDAARERFTIGSSVLATVRPDAREVAKAGDGAIAQALELFLGGL